MYEQFSLCMREREWVRVSENMKGRGQVFLLSLSTIFLRHILTCPAFSIGAENPNSDPHSSVAITFLTVRSLRLPMSASESLQPPLQNTRIAVNLCWVEAMIIGLFVPAETEHFRGNSDLCSCPVSSSCPAWNLARSYEHCLSSFPAASCLSALTSFPVSEHNLENYYPLNRVWKTQPICLNTVTIFLKI